jgi:hypothetical protein
VSNYIEIHSVVSEKNCAKDGKTGTTLLLPVRFIHFALGIGFRTCRVEWGTELPDSAGKAVGVDGRN